MTSDTRFQPFVLAARRSDSPTPLYHQLYSILKGMIVEDVLSYGERVPTESELADLFSVSRITSKRALDELAAEGFVERRRGRGTHVIYQYTPRPVQAPLTGMLQEIESMARNSRAIILESDMKAPPEDVREEMGLNDESVLHLRRVRERDGLKFGLYTSWTAGVTMPADPSIFETTPRLSFFRENGLELSHVTQTITAKLATHSSATALDVSVGSPLLSLTRRSYQQRGNGEEALMDWMEVLYNPDHFQYSMELKLD